MLNTPLLQIEFVLGVCVFSLRSDYQIIIIITIIIVTDPGRHFKHSKY